VLGGAHVNGGWLAHSDINDRFQQPLHALSVGEQVVQQITDLVDTRNSHLSSPDQSS